MNTGSISGMTKTDAPFPKDHRAAGVPGGDAEYSFAEKLQEQKEEKGTEPELPWQEYDRWQNSRERSRRKSEAEDDYWERRRLQKKRMKKWIKKQQEQKRLMEAAYEKAARREREAHQEQLERFLRGERLKAGGDPDRENEVRKAAQALAAYELSLLLTDIGG